MGKETDTLLGRMASMGLRLLKGNSSSLASIPRVQVEGAAIAREPGPMVATVDGKVAGRRFLAREFAEGLKGLYEKEVPPFHFMADVTWPDEWDRTYLHDAVSQLRSEGWSIFTWGSTLTMMHPDSVGF